MKKRKKKTDKQETVSKKELEKLSDEDLMLFCKEGNMPSFEILYARYSKRIMNYIYGIVGDYRQTENLTQELFLRIFKYAATYKYPQKFTTWLFALARNLSRSFLRKKMKRSGKVSLDSIDYNRFEDSGPAQRLPEESLQVQEHHDQIRTAINSLPTIYREVIFLYFFDNFNYNEISEIVGLNQSTLRSRMYYGLRKLKEIIARME